MLGCACLANKKKAGHRGPRGVSQRSGAGTAIAAMLSVAACASAPPRAVPAAPASAARPAATDLESFRRACAEAAVQRKAGTAAAYSLSLDLINSARFSELGSAEQHGMLAETAALGARLGDLAF